MSREYGEAGDGSLEDFLFDITADEEADSKADDQVRAYLKTIGKYKVLSHDEAVELFREYDDGDTAAAGKLILHNLRLVVNMAKRYQGRGVPFMDLIQEGNIGLITAVYSHHFDYKRGNEFSTYAGWWIKAAILQCLEDEVKGRTGINEGMQGKLSMIGRSREKLTQELGHLPTEKELAQYLLDSDKQKMKEEENACRSELKKELGREPDEDEVADRLGRKTVYQRTLKLENICRNKLKKQLQKDQEEKEYTKKTACEPDDEDVKKAAAELELLKWIEKLRKDLQVEVQGQVRSIYEFEDEEGNSNFGENYSDPNAVIPGEECRTYQMDEDDEPLDPVISYRENAASEAFRKLENRVGATDEVPADGITQQQAAAELNITRERVRHLYLRRKYKEYVQNDDMKFEDFLYDEDFAPHGGAENGKNARANVYPSSERALTRAGKDASRRIKTTLESSYCTYDFDIVLSQFREARDSNRRNMVIDIRDMLGKCGISYDLQRNDYEYFAGLAEQERGKKIPDFAREEDRILCSIFLNRKDFHTPEERMERLVNDLDPAGDRKESVRVRILKRFITKGGRFGYLKDTRKGKNTGKEMVVINGREYVLKYAAIKLYGDEAKWKALDDEKRLADVQGTIDDGIFNVLNGVSQSSIEATRMPMDERYKKDRLGGEYELLKMADDLSRGIFDDRSGYYFAFIYEMEYPILNENPADKKDIEYDLFERTYMNALFQYFSYEGGIPEPSGRGINYKSFVDLTYLRWLRKKCTPAEKLAGAEKMIAQICDIGKLPDNDQAEKDTTYYVSEAERMLSIEKDADFVEEICRHYDLGLTNAKQQNGAWEAYQTICRGIDRLREKTRWSLSREMCNYGFWFTDASKLSGEVMKRKLTENGIQAEDCEVDEFVRVLQRANGVIGYNIKEKETVSRSAVRPHRAAEGMLFLDSSEKVSRTSIITSYYYLYTQYHLADSPRKKQVGFKAFARDFSRGLNQKLGQAHYQLFNESCFFDNLICVSAYTYLNFE